MKLGAFQISLREMFGLVTMCAVLAAITRAYSIAGILLLIGVVPVALRTYLLFRIYRSDNPQTASERTFVEFWISALAIGAVYLASVFTTFMTMIPIGGLGLFVEYLVPVWKDQALPIIGVYGACAVFLLTFVRFFFESLEPFFPLSSRIVQSHPNQPENSD